MLGELFLWTIEQDSDNGGLGEHVDNVHQAPSSAGAASRQNLDKMNG